LISDDALSQAVGSPVHALGLISGAGSLTGTGPAMADMCAAQLGSDNALIMVHMTGVQTPGDVSGTLALSQGGPSPVANAIDPSTLTVVQVSGLGDQAVLLSGTPGGQAYANLIVWRGTEGFSLTGTGLSDAQTSLTTIAQSILAAQPSH
jgi:hypothetical protein